MCELEALCEGDVIAWWDDGHGRGATPGADGAIRRTGVVNSLVRRPYGTGPVVAVFVDCPSKLTGGVYTVAVAPHYGHQPEVVEKAPSTLSRDIIQ